MNIEGNRVLHTKNKRYVVFNSRKNTYDVMEEYITKGEMIFKGYSCIVSFDSEEEALKYLNR